MSQENVEIVRQVYERFNERDIDAAWELIAADAKFRFIVWGPDMTRTYEGREATMEFWRDEVFSVSSSLIGLAEGRGGHENHHLDDRGGGGADWRLRPRFLEI